MKGIRQLQAPALSTFAKELPAAIEQESAWTLEPAWGFAEEINLLPFAESKLGCSDVL
jgi:hypothetical protein